MTSHEVEAANRACLGHPYPTTVSRLTELFGHLLGINTRQHCPSCRDKDSYWIWWVRALESEIDTERRVSSSHHD